MMENGNIPQEALDLSRETMLPVRVGDAGEDIISSIDVINVPETNIFAFRDSVKNGFIQVFDYTNEYTDLSQNVVLTVFCPNGESLEVKPRVKEKHTLRYRHRFCELGEYSFLIKKGSDSVLNEGTFVIV